MVLCKDAGLLYRGYALKRKWPLVHKSILFCGILSAAMNNNYGLRDRYSNMTLAICEGERCLSLCVEETQIGIAK